MSPVDASASGGEGSARAAVGKGRLRRRGGADGKGKGGEGGGVEGGDEGGGDEGSGGEGSGGEGEGGEGEGGEGEGGFRRLSRCHYVEQAEREHGGEDAGERGRGESSQSRKTRCVGVGATICASGASSTSEEAVRR